MIEPFVSDKLCTRCGVVYPATAFYAKSGNRCKACIRQATAIRRGWKPPKPAFVWPQQPGDPRTPMQRQLSATQAQWRYPVEPAQLRWIA